MQGKKIVVTKGNFKAEFEVHENKVKAYFELPIADQEGFDLEEYTFIVDHILKLSKDPSYETKITDIEQGSQQ